MKAYAATLKLSHVPGGGCVAGLGTISMISISKGFVKDKMLGLSPVIGFSDKTLSGLN